MHADRTDTSSHHMDGRLLQPLKHRYGTALSWADLMVLTGTCALELMGLPTYGFAGGRLDAWEPDEGIWWGPEAWNPHDVQSPVHAGSDGGRRFVADFVRAGDKVMMLDRSDVKGARRTGPMAA